MRHPEGEFNQYAIVDAALSVYGYRMTRSGSNQESAAGARLLPFQKEVVTMTPQELLNYIAYLRRTVAIRDRQRATADMTALSAAAIQIHTETAQSDLEELAKLDKLEARIRAHLGM